MVVPQRSTINTTLPVNMLELLVLCQTTGSEALGVQFELQHALLLLKVKATVLCSNKH